MNEGLLIAVSGFSGAGKGSIMRRLMANYPGECALSVSATTREPREGETEGIDYHFRTKEEFERLIAEDRLIEYAPYVDNYYGTPKDFVVEQMSEGRDVLLEIEVQGALQVREKYPDTVLVFVVPPSIEELRRRLEGRGTETPEKIEKRLLRAREEIVYAYEYDYILVNDRLKDAVEGLRKIIAAEHSRKNNQIELLQKLQLELGGEV